MLTTTSRSPPKAVSALLGLSLALGLSMGASGSAWAAQGHIVVKPHPHVGLNCGWPHPDPGCAVTPTPGPVVVNPTPGPAPSLACLPTDMNCVFNTLMSVKQDVVTALQQTNDNQAAILNTSTGESWDTYLVSCLTGTPAQGTQGQNGYIAPQPGLIAWINGLQQPTLATVPPIVDHDNVAEAAEHARLIVLAGLQDVNTLVAGLKVGGVPKAISGPCGGFLQNAAVTVPTEIGAQWFAVNTLLIKTFPAAFALRDARMKLKP